MTLFFHASVTLFADDNLVSVMFSNEIPLSNTIAEWQYGRFGVDMCVQDIYVQEGWKVFGDTVVFTNWILCVCVIDKNMVCRYWVFEIQCKTLWVNSFRNWNYIQNATEQKCHLCYDFLLICGVWFILVWQVKVAWFLFHSEDNLGLLCGIVMSCSNLSLKVASKGFNIHFLWLKTETYGVSSEEIIKVRFTSGRWSKMLPEFDSHFSHSG